MDLTIVPRYTQASAGAYVGKAAGTVDDLFGKYALVGTLVFVVVVFTFEMWLNLRQRRTYHSRKFPAHVEATVSKIDIQRSKEGKKLKQSEDSIADIKDKVDPDAPLLPQLKSKFLSSQSYGLDKINFGIISACWGLAHSLCWTLIGAFPYMWDLSCHWGSKLGWTEEDDEIKISLVFLLLEVLSSTLMSLPFEIYSTFRIEKKHGFNKTTPHLFLTDKIKTLGLTAAIGGPAAAAVLKLIRWGGDRFYIYLWAFTFLFTTVMMTILPTFIMPLFNKYEPLPDGSLKDQINSLADKIQFPLTKLFVVDGSKRSGHSNAYMFGFRRNKRIVLYDTLISQVTEEELCAILGHELGHWARGHTAFNFCFTQAYFGAAFFFFSLCFGSVGLVHAFGFDDSARPVPAIVSLLLFFGTLWEPVDKALTFLMTMHSRKCEYEADEYSVKLGFGQQLQSGLCKINIENLGALSPDRLYSTYHYSHPPLTERLSAMMALDSKMK